LAIIHEATKEVICKVVYHGAGKCGKTTSLMFLNHCLPASHRGRFVSLETPSSRTLFFDLLPVITEAGGYRFRYLLYATPGQEYYQASRKLVLKGVDAIVFVVDSQRERAQDNWQAMELLGENMKALGQSLENIPMLIQYNKRDLQSAMPLEELERRFNQRHLLSFPAIARTGDGVVETMLAAAKMALGRFWAKGAEAGMGALFKTSVFMENDSLHFRKQLDWVRKEAEAMAVLLVDEGTGIIASSGTLTSSGTESVGAVLATNFTAAEELANGLGSAGFSGLMQRGSKVMVRAARIDKRRFLVLVCDRRADRKRMKDALIYFRGPLAAYLEQVDMMSPNRLPQFSELFSTTSQIALAGLEKN